MNRLSVLIGALLFAPCLINEAKANGLFGGVVFVNGESFSAAPGTRQQGIQSGAGPGLRIKLNKVSKTNVCIDYGFGSEGSRGLFVNIDELF